MSKTSHVRQTLPPAAASSLKRLGENIAIARARRNESQRIWADRIGISLPTLIRLERGDPTVSMGAYATALWLMGRVKALADASAPETDLGALEMEVRKVTRRRSSSAARAIREPPKAKAGA